MPRASGDPADPTFEQVVERSDEAVRQIAWRLRHLILEALPAAVEWVDIADGIVAFGGARRMEDVVLAIALHRSHVNLQFADGALLPDQGRLLEGTGKRIRHVKCRSVEDAERPALRTLIDDQLVLRRSRAL